MHNSHSIKMSIYSLFFCTVLIIQQKDHMLSS